MCYRSKSKKYKAIEYFKKALFYAYKRRDYLTEIHYYERLAVCYMDVGDTVRMKQYYERAVDHKIEPQNGTGRNFACVQIEIKQNKYLQELHGATVKKYRGGNQAMRKGLEVKDVDSMTKIDFCFSEEQTQVQKNI